MRYEEILGSILKAKNVYEDQKGIKTIDINEVFKTDDMAIITALKSDNTLTMFVAFSTSRKYIDQWLWLCPTENQIKNLHKITRNYFRIDQYNLMAKNESNR